MSETEIRIQALRIACEQRELPDDALQAAARYVQFIVGPARQENIPAQYRR